MITIKLTAKDINYLLRHKSSHNPIWRELFSQYNNALEASGHKPIAMTCTPCYFKVIEFYKINNEPVL